MPLAEALFCDTAADVARALRDRLPRPLAVVGIGNPLRGDDGFGPAVVGTLGPSPAWRLFDAQTAPESFLGPVAASGCPGVLFVDAADLGAAPGRVALVPAEALAEVDASTHALSLGLLAEALRGLGGSPGGGERTCALLAVQPAALGDPYRLSPLVERAVALAAEGLAAFAAGSPTPAPRE